MTNMTNEAISGDVATWLRRPEQWPLIAAESLTWALRRGRLPDVVDTVIKAAGVVHRELGPGQLRSVYEACFAYELRDRGLMVERQKALTVLYRNTRLECDQRLDFVINDELVVALATSDVMTADDDARLRTWLTVGGYPEGLLVNFNVIVLPNGIRRLVNELRL